MALYSSYPSSKKQLQLNIKFDKTSEKDMDLMKWFNSVSAMTGSYKATLRFLRKVLVRKETRETRETREEKNA